MGLVDLPTFTIVYLKKQPNVGKYTIHGWYGIWTFMIYQISESFDSTIFLGRFSNKKSLFNHHPVLKTLAFYFTSSPRRFGKLSKSIFPWFLKTIGLPLEEIKYFRLCSVNLIVIFFPHMSCFASTCFFLWPGFLSNGRIISAPTNLRTHPTNSMVIPSWNKHSTLKRCHPKMKASSSKSSIFRGYWDVNIVLSKWIISPSLQSLQVGCKSHK